MRNLSRCILIILCCGALFLPAPSRQVEPVYRTGLKTMRTLGMDVHSMLDRKYRNDLSKRPIFVHTDVTPFVRADSDSQNGDNIVWVSIGFVDLANHLGHAQAINKIAKKGYLEDYISQLARETGQSALKAPPGILNSKFWSDNIMDEQYSTFNQIVGFAVAVEMAHHYLGHYKKYKGKLKNADDQWVGKINKYLSTKEWQKAMEYGAWNSLDAVGGIDGILMLYQSFDKMKNRPDWSYYFLPEKTSYKKIRKELKKIEKRFYAGGSL